MKNFVFLLLMAPAFLCWNCKGTEGKPAEKVAAETPTTPTAPAAINSLPAPVASANPGTSTVMIETDLGNIKVRLFDNAPKHKANFLKLAKEGYYDGTTFHRVIPNFMVQGGDPDSKNAKPGQPLGQGGPNYTLDAEIGAKHFRGALAAARTGDNVNPQRRSSGSQFYIVQNGPVDPQMLKNIIQTQDFDYTPEEKDRYVKIGGTPNLDGQYTVFGEVVEGMDVVDKIAAAQRDQMDRPMKDIKMKVKPL